MKCVTVKSSAGAWCVTLSCTVHNHGDEVFSGAADKHLNCITEMRITGMYVLVVYGQSWLFMHYGIMIVHQNSARVHMTDFGQLLANFWLALKLIG